MDYLLDKQAHNVGNLTKSGLMQEVLYLVINFSAEDDPEVISLFDSKRPLEGSVNANRHSKEQNNAELESTAARTELALAGRHLVGLLQFDPGLPAGDF